MAIQPYEIANFNLINFASVYNDFISSEPKTLEVEYMDEDGDKKIIQLQNAGQIQQTILNDVIAEKDARIAADKTLQNTINSVNSILSSKIDDESKARISADSSLTSKIDDEIQRAQSTENVIKSDVSSLTSKLNDEIQRATDKENLISSTLDQEIQDRIAADNKLNTTLSQLIEDKVNTEKERAELAEGSLEFNDDIQDENGPASDLTEAINIVDNHVIANTEKFEQEVQDIKKLISTGDEKLQQEIQNEINARISGDEALEKLINDKIASLVDSSPDSLDTLNELAAALEDNPNFATDILNKISEFKEYIQSKLNQEIQDRQAADGSLLFNEDIKNSDGSTPTNLTDAINDVDDRLNAKYNIFQEVRNGLVLKDAELTDDLNNEIKRAQAAESDLDVKIDNEIQRAQTEENVLNNNIITEIQRAQEVEEVLNTKIENEIQRAQSAEGDLNFDDNIRNDDGSKPDNLTDAINDVNKKFNWFFGGTCSTSTETETVGAIDTLIIKSKLKELFQ